METPKFKDIAELHEYVFQLLLKEHEKDNSFLFTLRKPEDFTEETKNHWFYGGEDYLTFSFWSFEEIENSIYFKINILGKVDLCIAKDVYYNLVNYDGTYFSNFVESKQGIWAKRLTKLSLEIIVNYRYLIDAYFTNLNQFYRYNNCQISPNEMDENLVHIYKLREKQGKLKQFIFPFPILQPQTLSLTNITHFSQLNIDLSKRITCIIGENGSGKSSILKAIALSLVGTDKKRINASHKSIVNLLKINGLDAKNETKEWALTGEIALTYNETYRNEVHFQFEYGELSIRDEGAFENIQGIYYFPNLVLAFPQLQGKNENGNGISLIDMDKPNLKDIRALIYGESENPFEKLEAWIATLFAKGNQNEREKSKEHAIIAQLFEIISDVTASEVRFKTVIYEGENQIVWVSIPDAANGIPLSLISQGYSNVFGWIGYFMKRLAEVNPDADNFTQCPALVLIDEIDTYLHPKWQKDILQILADKFPHTQFIVTTHSPLVVTHLNNEKDDVAVYLIDKEKIEVIKVSGWDISSTLSEYFGVERRPIYYQAQIDDLFAEFEEDMINIDLIKEKILQLKSVLGENNPDIQSAERILTGISE